MAAELGDASIEALALAGLARVALTSDVAKAVYLVREALVITEGLPDDSEGGGSALHVLGAALQMAGDFEGAREVIERRIALARTAGNSFVVWVEMAKRSMVERQRCWSGRVAGGLRTSLRSTTRLAPRSPETCPQTSWNGRHSAGRDSRQTQ